MLTLSIDICIQIWYNILLIYTDIPYKSLEMLIPYMNYY